MARSTPPSLNYQPLSDANNDIRILIIEPSQYLDDRISCRLEHVPLAASSDYVALSYCWGRPTWSVPVTINGTTTYITPSLADALSVLRQRGFTRVWADAICINQADMEERSRQVLRMAAIYRSATDVLARPGDANGDDVNTLLRLIPDVKKLLKFGVNYDPLRFQDTPDGRALRDRTLRRIIRQVRHMRDKKPAEDLKKKTDKQKAQEKRTQKAWSHIRSNLQDKRWEALARLLRCEYWSRVWIIQELAMANHLQVVWGFHPFSFGDIALLVVAFDMLHRARLVGNVLPTKACSHVKSLMEFQNLQRRLTAVPLIRALWMSSFAKATDPRDKVYSLTGLTYDGTIIFPTPSYGRGLDDIKREATLRIIQINDSLDHLVFRSVPPGSWVIDWFDAGTWSDSRAVAYLTGQAKFRAQYGAITTWSASGSSRPLVGLKDDRLEVKGTIIDTIRDCSATYSERGSSATTKTSMQPCKKKDATKQIDQCFDLVKRENDQIMYVDDFFAGIEHSLATATPSKQASAIKEWVFCSLNSSVTIAGYSLRKWFEPTQHSWFTRMWGGSSLEMHAHNATVRATRTLKLGMRLGETVQGRLGWFTKFAKPGDKVAIVAGCSVPVVLRPLAGKNNYMLVGDSIIPGIMRGEKKSVLDQESVLLLS